MKKLILIFILTGCGPSEEMQRLDKCNDSLTAVKYGIEVSDLVKHHDYTTAQAIDSVNKWSK